MIFGDTLLITRNGIEVNSKILETIGVFEGSRVYILPLRTFEYRKGEASEKSPLDLFITPIHPKHWPFVLRFELRIYNNPTALERAYEFFYKMGINILFSESTRSGHHHTVLNVLGTLNRLEGKTLQQMFEDFKYWIDSEKMKKITWYHAISNFSKETTNNKAEKKKNKSKNERNKKKESRRSYDEIINSLEDNKKDKNKFSDWFDDEFKNGENATSEELGRIIGFFYRHLYGKTTDKGGNAIQVILHKEIDRLRPIIRNYQEEKKEKKEKKELYESIEKEIIPLKELLNFILSYKQKLIEKLEIQMLKDSLLLEREIENDIDFCNLDSMLRSSGENYIYNIKHYESIIKHASYFKEWFIKDNKQFDDNSEVLIRINKFYKKIKCNKKKKNKIKQLLNNLFLLKVTTILKRKENENEDLFKPENDINNLLKELLEVLHLSKDKKNSDKTIDKYNYNCKKLLKLNKIVKEVTDKKIASLNINRDELINNWDNILQIIFYAIKKLPSGRKRFQPNKSRIDLDPIIITPVESLNHAYYHLAYHRDFYAFAKVNGIPFPTKDSIYYPVDVFETFFRTSSKTMFAITSRNTDDLTLRLSPITQINSRFFSISLESYKRNCYKECSINSLELFGKEKTTEIKSIVSLNNCNSDEEKANESENCEHGEKICKGTSRGVMYGFIKAINNVEKQNNFLILRVYNQKKYNLSKTELGGITMIVEYRGTKSIKELENDIQCKLNEILESIGTSKHLTTGKIKIEQISSGSVFISIPFNNPMTKTWIKIIKEEAEKVGMKAFASEVYTESVTLNLKNRLQESDAMIQIFAKELNDADKNERNSGYQPIWLYSEFFNVFGEKPIIRLIDTKTVKKSDIMIAKDNASLFFSVADPESKFREKVATALSILQKQLAKSKGIS